jgi:hypothetical protein
VSDYDAATAAWWARACARDFGIRAPNVRFYRAPTSVRCGYVDLKIPGVVFFRAGMDLSETRSTIAHEIAHLAGADERAARRYEQPDDRERGGRRHTSGLSRLPTTGRGTPPGCGVVESV